MASRYISRSGFLIDLLGNSNLTIRTRNNYIYNLMSLNNHQPIQNLDFLVDDDKILKILNTKAPLTKSNYLTSIVHVLNKSEELGIISMDQKSAMYRYNMSTINSSRNYKKYRDLVLD